MVVLMSLHQCSLHESASSWHTNRWHNRRIISRYQQNTVQHATMAHFNPTPSPNPLMHRQVWFFWPLHDCCEKIIKNILCLHIIMLLFASTANRQSFRGGVFKGFFEDQKRTVEWSDPPGLFQKDTLQRNSMVPICNCPKRQAHPSPPSTFPGHQGFKNSVTCT